MSKASKGSAESSCQKKSVKVGGNSRKNSKSNKKRTSSKSYVGSQKSGVRSQSSSTTSNRRMRTESEFVWSNEAMPHNKNADQVFAEVCGPKRLSESVKEPIDYFLRWPVRAIMFLFCFLKH